ncbi:hypothetical protein AB6N23_03180 [Cellulomonas sp. 179-A 9B4 NHS]|uniref:hypothetical protein n=1 Tax=Cellulomonas sp. 179-A 9B4 NHS TaxID=3142379 RepID=UPI0039A235D2
MEQVEAIVREQCADLLAGGRLRVVDARTGDHGIPQCTVATDRFRLLTWIYHGELDGTLRPAWPDAEPLDLRWTLRHLGADWGETWNREGIMAAFAEHVDRIDAEAADPVRWDAFRAAAHPRA